MAGRVFSVLGIALALLPSASLATGGSELSVSSSPDCPLATHHVEPDAHILSRGHGLPSSHYARSGNATVADARQLVAMGQAAMAKANAEILSRPAGNTYDTLNSTGIKESKEPAPFLNYDNHTAPALARRQAPHNTTGNLTHSQWSSYRVPHELAEAARIMAEANPPSKEEVAAKMAAMKAYANEDPTNDTYAMPPVLQKPNGLSEVVDEPPSAFRYADNSTSSDKPAGDEQGNLSKRSSGDWWMANIQQRGSSPYAPEGYKVWRNVKDYGARGDGSADDTAAINRAISEGGRCGANCGSSTVYPATVYFPPGVYIVSSSIIQYYNTEIIGDPDGGTLILAAPSFVGLGVITSDIYTGTKSEWYLNTNNFLRSIRNIYIDIEYTPQNAQVCGIHWQVAQGTSLHNIIFWSDDSPDTTQQGIYMENGSGGSLSNLKFRGGKYGAYMGAQQFTAMSLWFKDIVDTAIQIHWDWGWTMQDVNIINATTGLKIVGGAGGPLSNGQGVGSVVLTDTTAQKVNTLISTSLFADNSTAFVLQNALVGNVDVLVEDSHKGEVLLPGPGTGSATVKSWGFGRISDSTGDVAFVNGAEVPAPERDPSLTIPGGYSRSDEFYFKRPRPLYFSIGNTQIIDVKAWGAQGDGITNDAPALNYIFSAAANMSAIVYVPYGVYVLEDTLTVPVGSRIIGQAWPQLMGSGSKFEDMHHPRPVVKVGDPGNEGVIEIQTMMFTVRGPTAGAVLLEWNVHESFQGSAALWDSHFRVGGAAGSDLQAEDCPKLTGSVNPKCIAATLMLHITEKASAYIDNAWVWTADHDMDKLNQDQIDVYTGRGILVESQGPTWLWGTSAEHCVMYQYQISGAKNVVMGLIQTESPYYQPDPVAPAPFEDQVGAFSDDPTFDHCEGPSDLCGFSWAMRVVDSSTVYVLSTGFYTWFQGYDRECIDNGEKRCQQEVFYTEQSYDVWIYNLVTIGAIEMISPLNGVSTSAANNRNGFASSILAWLGGAEQTTGERTFKGYEIYDRETLRVYGDFTDSCVNALSATIKCSQVTRRFQERKFYGSLGNETLTDLVCDKGCREDIGHWVSHVRHFCDGQTWRDGAPAEVNGAQIQYGLNETCLLAEYGDSKYCSDDFSNFFDADSVEGMRATDVCSTCYLNRLQMMQASSYSVYRTAPVFKDTLEFALRKCWRFWAPTEDPPPIVPPTPDPEPFCLSGVTYTTVDGDTCNSISEKHSVASAALFSANSKIVKCSSIPAGIELCMPPQCETFAPALSDSCLTIATTRNLQESEVIQFNPWLNQECSNLHTATYAYGNVLCLSPPGGLYNGTTDNRNSNPAAHQYTDSKVDPPEGTTVAKGTTLQCGRWHVVKEGESCARVTTQNITADLFRRANPSLQGGDCTSKLVTGQAYCTGPVFGWNKAIPDLNDYHSFGCYTQNSNRKLVLTGQYVTQENDLDVEACGAYCVERGYPYWGIQKGTTCSCGFALALDSEKVDDGECSVPCDGGESELCGGETTVSVYGSMPKLYRDRIKLGCYVDTSSNHALSSKAHVDEAMTTSMCAERCLAEHLYFGVARGNECYCGDKIGASAQKRDSGECDMECAGDNFEFCGSENRILVYTSQSEEVMAGNEVST